MRYGLKSVTMDDIARHLGISKKTLYEYVDNKADLIGKILDSRVAFEQRMMQQIKEESDDAVEEMLKLARYSIQMLRKLSPTAVYDLKKYYKDLWMAMESLHLKEAYEIIRNNIERGIEQGVYRSDMDPAIISRLYIGKINHVVDDDMFPTSKYDKANLFKEFFNYHMHGIASPKGLELLEKHYQKIVEES